MLDRIKEIDNILKRSYFIVDPIDNLTEPDSENMRSIIFRDLYFFDSVYLQVADMSSPEFPEEQYLNLSMNGKVYGIRKNGNHMLGKSNVDVNINKEANHPWQHPCMRASPYHDLTYNKMPGFLFGHGFSYLENLAIVSSDAEKNETVVVGYINLTKPAYPSEKVQQYKVIGTLDSEKCVAKNIKTFDGEKLIAEIMLSDKYLNVGDVYIPEESEYKSALLTFSRFFNIQSFELLDNDGFAKIVIPKDSYVSIYYRNAYFITDKDILISDFGPLEVKAIKEQRKSEARVILLFLSIVAIIVLLFYSIKAIPKMGHGEVV
jgi:hypothetical protein